jgi:protein involved in polysaccharide export with SLBB domain
MYHLRFTIYDLKAPRLNELGSPSIGRVKGKSSIINGKSQEGGGVMSSIRRAGFLFAVIVLSVSLAGCSDKFWDPTQVGRFRPTPAVNVILDSLGAAEETPVAWENGEEPRPSDVVPVRTDYVLSPGDLVRVSIFELLQEGILLVNDYVISETGRLSIPDVGIIQAAGLTETQLEDQIKQSLSPNVLREPSVTVTLMNSQQRTFSVLGNGVSRPSRYVIPRNDFRLMDALATAGAQMQFNVSYVYVSRKEEGAAGVQTQEVAPVPVGESEKRIPELELIKPEPQQSELPSPNIQQPAPTPFNHAKTPAPRTDIPEPAEPAEKFETEREMLDLIAPHARSNAPPQGTSWPATGKVAGTGAKVTKNQEDEVTATVLPRGFRLLVPPKRVETKNPALAPVAPPKVVPSPVEFGRGTPRFAQAQPVTGAPMQNDAVGKGSQTQQAPLGGLNPTLPPSDAKAQERIEWIFRDGNWVPVPVTTDQNRELPAAQSESGFAAAPRGSAPADPSGGFDWVFRDGRWTTVPKGQTSPPTRNDALGNATPSARPPVGKEGLQTPTRSPESGKGFPTQNIAAGGPKLPMELEWEQAIQTRLIRIPAEKLLAGDPRYNIVIKPGDTIHVPVDIIGEFAIMGNVNRSGFINITGRPMTLKMAIAAAGGLGPLAWPKHVEVVRRVGAKKEEIVLVDLDKIAAGEQPDFFIKPNDLINVGTEATTRWRAVLRNAFRAAYGFGFVYDRNFADIDFGTGFPFFTNF